ncbi:Coenzyme F420 hydrogenase/dehydrogenase, beta subunit C-terminal domain [Caulobacter segnis]|uniref:Coenzyme F420 hydrogenase/dehydrogenase, beta subunit C-terminal domain n=1 Tax=Caulobacter segnis TaxID=88688 RepID=UPI001CBAF822|nr:Coenzyme F420 hydrogenase/dehydrogenase, beta subunit C-terminal domain [Caulobacter segnis]UAL08904.1 Coenzyme F420 hydrogenase/dehydrogenase, beta subunit C-terminal domain [Caulobacter segnis]
MQLDEAGYLRPTRHVEQNEINGACPGDQVFHHNISKYDELWGPLLSTKSAYALDPEIRFQGSSGGVITAILSHLLSTGKVDAVIQVGVDRDFALLNDTYVHASSHELVANAGSRYSPSAPLEAVRALKADDARRFAFVGKPCDVAALRHYVRNDPALSSRFPFMISFICAGVPSQKGTEAILEKMGANASDVVGFKYRGAGWPGMTRATDKQGKVYELTYNEAWGRILNRHLQPRCKLCADGTGEAADIVCGDAWYESKDGYPSFEERDGRSLLLVRTEIGRLLVSEAERVGAISSEDVDPADIELMQPYQANRKRSMLARSVAVKLTGGQPPRYPEQHLYAVAIKAGPVKFARAVLSTMKRRLQGRI